MVTGASAGLGAQTARQLAAHGATVVLACRSIEKGEAVAAGIRAQVPGAQLPVLRMDLASLASVREAAARLHDGFGRIDVLINNAGTLTRVRSVSVDGFETTFATNHLGHFALTGLVLDLLAPAGRVVSVSSRASGYRSTTVELADLGFEHREYKPMHVYGQSKLANLLFIFELQRQLAGAGTTLVAAAAYPGVATSDFNRNLGPTARLLSHPALRPSRGWSRRRPRWAPCRPCARPPIRVCAAASTSGPPDAPRDTRYYTSPVRSPATPSWRRGCGRSPSG